MAIWDFLYIIINIICVAALIYLIIALSPHRKIPAAKAFLFLSGVLSLWMMTLANQVTMCFSPSHVIFLNRLSESLFVLIPIGLANLVDKYATRARMMRKWTYVIFGIVITAILTLIWTNQFHHFYWQVETILMNGNHLQLYAERTIWVKVLMVIFHLEITFTAFHFINLVTQLNLFYKRNIRTTSISLAITAIFSALALVFSTDMKYDFLPIALAFCCFSLAQFMVEHDIYDLVPISRSSYFDQLADGAMITSRKGTIIDISNGMMNQFGFDRMHELIGQDILHVFPQWKDKLHKVLATQEDQTTFLTVNEPDQEIRYDVTMHANIDMYGFISTVLIKFQDVTFYRHLVDQVNELAIRDPLTGILNRRHFELLVKDHLKLARRYHRNGCLMMFDLDNFKDVNDFYGHQTGDKVLTEFTRSIAPAMRSSDIFARYGGDEFLLYLPETDIQGAIIAASHMEEFIVGKTIEIEDLLVPLKCSVGITDILPAGNETVTYDDLICRVDQAMYASKKHTNTSVGILQNGRISFHIIVDEENAKK